MAVEDGFDGLMLIDTDDRYVLAARITGLRLASVSTAQPYELDLRKDAGPFLIDLTQHQALTRIEILNLPDSLQATLDPDSGSLSLTGSAPIGAVHANMSDPDGVAGRATSVALTVLDLPTELDLTFGSGPVTTIDAHGSRIGLIDVLLTSGPDLAVPDGYDGVVLIDTPATYALAGRITGLRLASVTTQAPYTLDLRKDAGPFLIDLTQGQATTRIEILDLPNSLQATLDPAGSAAYVASAPIGELSVSINDPEGVINRATELELLLQELPASLDLTFDQGATAGVDAHGARIGLIDFHLTSGPVLQVPAGYDGLLLEDVPAHYAIAARITGLRAARVSTAAPYEFTLSKDAGPFRIHMLQGARDVLVDIRNLPSSVSATLDPSGHLTYTGSATIGALDAVLSDPAGIAGRATLLRLELRGIPTSLSMDFDTASAAGIDAHGAAISSVDLFATSGPALSVDPGYQGVVLQDLPSHFAVAARLTGLRVARVTTGTAPYTLTLQKDPGPFLVRLEQGQRNTLVRIHDLPSSMTATLDPAGSLKYSASAPVSEITADLSDPAGVAGRATQARALLRSVPANLDVSWAAASGRITADAKGATVGLLEVLLTSGPTVTLPDDRDGLILEDLADRYVMFGRLVGLKKVTFTQGPPPSFDLQTTGGRLFEVSLKSQRPNGGQAVTTGLVERLPASIAVSFVSSTSLTYRASAPIDRLTLDAVDPSGISGRATELHASLTSLPVALDAGWSSSGTVTLDARGGTVGLVELQLTSGPNDRLPANVDGVLLNDLADRYVVFARITGLRSLVGTQSPSPDITLSTTGGRVLSIQLNELDGSKVEYTRATLTTLPTTVRIRVAGQQMFYDASAPTTSLVLDTNSGDRWNLHADIRNPVPARLQFCAAGNGACTGYRRSAGAGSFYFDASEHTSVNLFDCVRPLNASCQRGNASEFAQVDNWRVRHFEFDADADSTGFSGYTFNNTNGHALEGYLLYISGDVGFEANIRPGYSSSNRQVEWDAWGLFKDKSGSVNCAGSNFSIRIIGIWIGVTSYVC
jgi:hypothetical protein